MSLQATYQKWLASPTSSPLADDAALHFVTTLTSISGAGPIIKHVSSMRNQMKKKKESALYAIESVNAVAVEMETVLEFVTSGSSYLPGLDDNFLADRVVSVPIMHIVTFNEEGKIQQIRQSWDQGAMLKQVEVMGKSSRNWPIRDSNDQIKLISKSAAIVNTSIGNGNGNGNGNGHSDGSNTSNGNGAAGSMSSRKRQPEAAQEASISSVISPKGGARPRQRGFVEILGDEPAEVDVDTPERARDQSPSKSALHKSGASKKFRPSRLFEAEEAAQFVEDGEPGTPSHGRGQPTPSNLAKSGAGKNYTRMRLFDTDEAGKLAEVQESPGESKPSDRKMRPDPSKYKHFEFADGTDPQDKAQPGDADFKKTKHSSQWSFDDFTTPQKPRNLRKPGKTSRESPNWGTEEADGQNPVKPYPVPSKARRDAEAHFDMAYSDEDDEQVQPEPRKFHVCHHSGNDGLYENNVYNEGSDPNLAPATSNQALGNITNTNQKGRDRTFGDHFDMTDNSPRSQSPAGFSKPKVSEDRQKAVKMMDPHWGLYDTSPAQKENQPTALTSRLKVESGRGIRIGGDGMGGSKGTERDWLFPESKDDVVTRKAPGRQPGGATKSNDFSWDF